MKRTRIKKLLAVLLTSVIALSGMSAVLASPVKQVNAASLSYAAKAGYTGWKYMGGYWYYFENGTMVKGWKKVNGYWYYMDTYGRMETGWWQNYGGDWYYFGSDGAMRTGWEKINGTWYYFDESNSANEGKMAYGWEKIDGEWYYFGGKNDGAMKTGWQWVAHSGYYGGTVYDWFYFGSSGAMYSGGWRWVNGKQYYFNNEGVCTNRTSVDGVIYIHV